MQIFFIISGFYMTIILNKKYIGKGSYKLFISNRLLRLYPSYLITVILTILASILSYIIFDKWGKLTPWIDNINILDFKTLLILLLTNITLMGQDIIMFTGINNINGNLYFLNNFSEANIKTYQFLLLPQAWSISLELFFYAIAPFIIRKDIKVIVLFILASILLRLFIYLILEWNFDPWTYRFFPTELALFLFGAIAFKIYDKHDNFKMKVYHLILIGFYFLLIIFNQYLPETLEIKKWFFYLLSVLVIPILFHISKKNKIDNFIGELSYPIYLIHMLVIGLFSRFISEIYKGETFVIISIVLAIFLVKFIEEPINRIRQRRMQILKIKDIQ